jgi:hypothetical protein
MCTPHCLTDRCSAVSNSASRARPCPRSMLPDGNQGQLSRGVVGPLRRFVGRHLATEIVRHRRLQRDPAISLSGDLLSHEDFVMLEAQTLIGSDGMPIAR